MGDQRDAIMLKLAEKKGQLNELRAERAPYADTAEIAGDWSKRKEALEKEISDLEAQLAIVDEPS